MQRIVLVFAPGVQFERVVIMMMVHSVIGVHGKERSRACVIITRH